MYYNDFIQAYAKSGLIETADVKFHFDEPVGQIHVRLSQWVQQGKLIQLRRGKYLLPPEISAVSTSHFAISNFLHRPSYISQYSALEFYELIPETVHEIRAVTTRQTSSWNTAIGLFSYSSIQPNRFFGYSEMTDQLSNQKMVIASPEKALIDLLYFQKGEWTIPRMNEMRFQNLEILNIEKLIEYSEKMNSPKISRGVNNFLKSISMMEKAA